MSPATSPFAWPGLSFPSLLPPHRGLVLSGLASGALLETLEGQPGVLCPLPIPGRHVARAGPRGAQLRGPGAKLHHLALAAHLPQLDAGPALLPR